MVVTRSRRLGVFSLCPSDKIPYFGIRKICRVHASHLGEDRIPAQSLGDEGEDDSPGLLVSTAWRSGNGHFSAGPPGNGGQIHFPPPISNFSSKARMDSGR